MSAAKRVALYGRISTRDKGQDVENQLAQLRDWCAAKGYPIAGEYVDRASGSKGADKRDRLAAMLADAHKLRFDLVLFWALDRLSREGMVATIDYLRSLTDAGVEFHSYSEPYLSTESEIARNILLAAMSSLAKAERERIRDRVVAGLERARVKGTRSGKAIGRPRLAENTLALVRHALRDGLSIRATAAKLGIGLGSVHRIASEMRGG